MTVSNAPAPRPLSKGEKLAQGPQGMPGPQGEHGPPGPAGPAGPRGVRGAVGRDGPQGPHGAEGPAGERGQAGEPGPRGPIGRTGYDGETGPEGPPGPASTAPGPAGPQGLQGNSVQGPPGSPGPQGPQGAEGQVGPAGPRGEAGPPGFHRAKITTDATNNSPRFREAGLSFGVSAGTDVEFGFLAPYGGAAEFDVTGPQAAKLLVWTTSVSDNVAYVTGMLRNGEHDGRVALRFRATDGTARVEAGAMVRWHEY